MIGNLDRRLARLEATEVPPLRHRYVWLSRRDDPVPDAEPNEELIIVQWLWDDEEEPAR